MIKPSYIENSVDEKKEPVVKPFSTKVLVNNLYQKTFMYERDSKGMSTGYDYMPMGLWSLEQRSLLQQITSMEARITELEASPSCSCKQTSPARKKTK
tara:strand:- start:454 stop:747 length:294 start_codon:yes stop_codon:yes gene_type:complete